MIYTTYLSKSGFFSSSSKNVTFHLQARNGRINYMYLIEHVNNEIYCKMRKLKTHILISKVFSIYRCERMQHMSESVFQGLCFIVGTSQQVPIRRDMLNTQEVVVRGAKTNDANTLMVSGSRREGFWLKGSDMDIMYWPNNHRVIMEMSQSKYYRTAKYYNLDSL